MEQTLTTAAFISAALFTVWILLVDPAADDVHAGLDMTFLGALLMVPVVVLLLVGIVLLFPIVIAVILIGLLLYGIFLLLRWFMTREKSEDSTPSKESKVLASLRRIEKGIKALAKSRPVRTAQERVKESGTRVRASLRSGTEKARSVFEDRVKKVQESPSAFREKVRRVREGTKEKAGKIREKVDHTIAVGRQRVRSMRDRDAKHASDESQPSAKSKDKSSSGVSETPATDSSDRSSPGKREASESTSKGDASRVRHGASSDRTAQDRSGDSSQGGWERSNAEEKVRTESQHHRVHGDTGRRDDTVRGDNRSASSHQTKRDHARASEEHSKGEGTSGTRKVPSDAGTRQTSVVQDSQVADRSREVRAEQDKTYDSRTSHGASTRKVHTSNSGGDSTKEETAKSAYVASDHAQVRNQSRESKVQGDRSSERKEVFTGHASSASGVRDSGTTDRSSKALGDKREDAYRASQRKEQTVKSERTQHSGENTRSHDLVSRVRPPASDTAQTSKSPNIMNADSSEHAGLAPAKEGNRASARESASKSGASSVRVRRTSELSDTPAQQNFPGRETHHRHTKIGQHDASKSAGSHDAEHFTQSSDRRKTSGVVSQGDGVSDRRDSFEKQHIADASQSRPVKAAGHDHASASASHSSQNEEEVALRAESAPSSYSSTNNMKHAPGFSHRSSNDREKNSSSKRESELQHGSSRTEQFSYALRTKWVALKKRFSGAQDHVVGVDQEENARTNKAGAERGKETKKSGKNAEASALRGRFRDFKARMQQRTENIGKRRTTYASASGRIEGDTSARQRFVQWAKNIFHTKDLTKMKAESSPKRGPLVRGKRRVREQDDGGLDLFSEEYLRNMRPIGWKTRREMDETYHPEHRRKRVK